jgi:hypothetical protein
MQPIKFVKEKENIYNYDTMTLVNIISHRKQMIYFFIVEFEIISNGNKVLTKDLLELTHEEYDDEIYLNYKIV